MLKVMIFILEKAMIFFMGLLSLKIIDSFDKINKILKDGQTIIWIILFFYILKKGLESLKYNENFLENIKKIINVKINELILLIAILIPNVFMSSMIFLFLIYYKYFFCEFKNESKSKQIYPSRKDKGNILRKYLSNKNVTSILIDGDWGTGKTTFIDIFLSDKKNKDLIPIKIKVSIFKDKIEIRNFIFKEIRKILKNNNIETSDIDDIIKTFNSLKNGRMDSFFKSTTTLCKNREKLKNSVKKLTKKKIVIVLDDLERINNEEKIKEIINLIADLEEFVNLKILILTNYSKLHKNNDYFEKYIDGKIFLEPITYEEILEQEFNDEKLINLFKKVFKSYFLINYDNLIGTKNTEEMHWKISNVQNKIKNPRFIKKLIEDIKKSNFTEFVKNSKVYTEYTVLKIYTDFFIFREIFSEEYMKMVTSKMNIYFHSYQYLKDDSELKDKNPETFYFFKIFDILKSDTVKSIDNISNGNEEYINTITQLTFNRQLKTLSCEYQEKTKSILAIYRNSGETPTKSYEEIYSDISHVLSTISFIKKSDFEEFKKYFLIKIISMYKDKLIDITDLISLIYRENLADIFLEEDISKIKEIDYFVNKDNFDPDLFFNIDFSILKNYHYFFEIIGCHNEEKEIDFYYIDHPSGTAITMSDFNFTKRFLNKMKFKSEGNIEKDVNTFLNWVEKKVIDLDKEVLTKTFEAIKLHYDFVLDIYNFIKSKPKDKYTKKYIKIEDIEEKYTLINGIKDGFYKKEDISKNKDYIKENLGEIVYIRSLQLFEKDIKNL